MVRRFGSGCERDRVGCHKEPAATLPAFPGPCYNGVAYRRPYRPRRLAARPTVARSFPSGQRPVHWPNGQTGEDAMDGSTNLEHLQTQNWAQIQTMIDRLHRAWGKFTPGEPAPDL